MALKESIQPLEKGLLLRGFFHDRMIPPLSTLGLEESIPDLPEIALARTLMTSAASSNYQPALSRFAVAASIIPFQNENTFAEHWLYPTRYINRSYVARLRIAGLNY